MERRSGTIAGIDIDGVLANPEHRLHHVAGRPKNWRAFFAAVSSDSRLEEGLAAVNDLVSAGVTIVYVSGRPEYLRAKTESWLRRQGFPDAPMYLRPRGDFRPAPVLKTEIYRRLSREFDVRVIVDDDPGVVQALRDAGFEVQHAQWFQPDSPAETAALRHAQDDQGRT